LNFIKNGVLKLKNLKLPIKERYKFAEPLGTLISGTREETIPKVERFFKELTNRGFKLNFYLVGDIVTMDFLKNDFLKKFIKLCIIDEKTQRKSVELNFGKLFQRLIEIENPAGTITVLSWQVLKKIVNSKKKTILRITEGEEDLLVLPLVLEIPIKEGVKDYIIYGQPPITDAKINIPQGIVLVEVSEKIKEKVKLFINLMEEF